MDETKSKAWVEVTCITIDGEFSEPVWAQNIEADTLDAAREAAANWIVKEQLVVVGKVEQPGFEQWFVVPAA